VSGPYVPPDRLPELNKIITSAARDAGDRERQSRLFAEQVVPAVRESLARLASQPYPG